MVRYRWKIDGLQDARVLMGGEDIEDSSEMGCGAQN